MTRLALMALLALTTLIPPRQAAAQDALGGAIIGGAAVASQGDPRPGGYYYYNNGCYLPRADGSYVLVDPGYCAAPPPPPPRYVREGYAPGPACTRSPTFDPRDGTFIDRYGYRRRCI